jgi:hypothetical protein
VIIDDFDIDRASLRPPKANAVLIVDANRMPSGKVPPQCFQTISGRNSKLI